MVTQWVPILFEHVRCAAGLDQSTATAADLVKLAHDSSPPARFARIAFVRSNSCGDFEVAVSIESDVPSLPTFPCHDRTFAATASRAIAWDMPAPARWTAAAERLFFLYPDGDVTTHSVIPDSKSTLTATWVVNVTGLDDTSLPFYRGTDSALEWAAVGAVRDPDVCRLLGFPDDRVDTAMDCLRQLPSVNGIPARGASETAASLVDESELGVRPLPGSSQPWSQSPCSSLFPPSPPPATIRFRHGKWRVWRNHISELDHAPRYAWEPLPPELQRGLDSHLGRACLD